MKDLQIFLLVIVLGFVLEFLFFEILSYLLGRPFKTHHKYLVGRRISLAIIPIWGLIAFLILGNFGYVKFFIVASAVGTSAEYLVGEFIAKISGGNLWSYHFFRIGKHSSFLSIFYWGGAGLLFYLIAKFLGL